MAGITDAPIKLFGGSTDVPTPTAVPLDGVTQGMINDGLARAGRPSSDFADDINQGVAQNANSLGQDSQHASQEDQQMGGNPQHMSDALRQAYSAKSGANIGRLMKSNQYKGELAKADYMNRMSQTVMAQQKVATQNNAMLVDAYNQNEMARAQFVNSLFQIGQQGMVMGAMSMRKSGPKKPEAPASIGGSGVGNESYGSGGMGDPGPSFGSGGGME